MNKTASRLLILGAAAMFAVTGWAYNKSMFPYDQPAGKQGAALHCVRAQEGMKLELGKWYTNFTVCKKYADENGLPLLAVWSNHGCVHCWYTDIVFIQDDFKAWQATHDAGKVICCYMAGGDDDIDQAGSQPYNWMWYGGGNRLNAYPFVVMWWKKGNVNVRMTGDQFCAYGGSTQGFTDATIPTRVKNVENCLTAAFKNWKAEAPYSGGAFAVEETSGNRLEVESNGSKVLVSLTRAADVAAVATNNLLSVVGPDGKTVSTVSVPWKAGETSMTVEVDLSGVSFTKSGQQASLVLKDANGTAKGTVHVTYVVAENSSENPLWIGERSAPAAKASSKKLLAVSDAAPAALEFGEWTMDLDVAKATAAAADGEAYTLVAVVGALWCPDCANTERNFTSLVDGSGNSRFRAWAKENNVALVSVDIPNFTDAQGSFASPTLLSRAAYNSTLARVREYPASGADASLTNTVKRSGLGYLTRKGVSDAEAAKVLARNRDLVRKNTEDGGFHRAEDRNSNRTGVPIFVLLRKDGSVAARMTRFAAVSPMKADQANFDNYIKRFDEMLKIAADDGDHADAGEPSNNYPGAGATSFQANGGKAAGEISHTDFQDVFKLAGVGGNALQKVTVKGAKSANVQVSFKKLGSDGKAETVGSPVTGDLSKGVSLEATFTSAGDYYVEVAGADITSAAFAAENAAADAFYPFEVGGAVVLVPQESVATAKAPAGSDKVTMRIVNGQTYKISGLDDNAVKAFLAPLEDGLYSGRVTGDEELTTASVGGEVSYQIWKPGSVGFAPTTAEAKETDSEVRVTMRRTGGSSGAVTVSVAVDEEKTTFLDIEGKPRYEFAGEEVRWKDGDNADKSVTIRLKDDDVYDGDGVVALKMLPVSGSADITADSFSVTVTEDDKASPGRVAFVGAAEGFAKKQTVYAKATAGATLYVDRIEAADGRITATVKSSLAGVGFGGDATEGGVVAWANRDGEQKSVKVTGIPAGKSAKFTFSSITGGATALMASNTITVVSLSDAAPEFADGSASAAAIYRFIAYSASYPLAAAPAGRVSFTKVSGAIPAGLKVSYDATRNAMVVAGTPSAKVGSYSAVFQAKDGALAGLTKELSFTVADPTDAKASPETANKSVAKARTFRDIPIVNDVNSRLPGILQVTIPTKGNVSAKYTCEFGVKSLSAKGWDGFDPETKELHATASGKGDYSLDVTCRDDGSVLVVVNDPNYAGVSLDAEVDPKSIWTKNAPATAWKGYYTVALVPNPETVDEDRANMAPMGCGYLTLKMNKASEWNTGKVKWVGMLPNGTAVSGSSLLSYAGRDKGVEWAVLPVFKKSSRDTISVLAKIRANAVEEDVTRAVFSADGVVSCWEHYEKDAGFGADYIVDFAVFGGPYDATVSLADCCQEYYETTSPTITFDTSLLGWTSYGVPGGSVTATVTVGEKTLSLAAGAPAGMTLKLSRGTGVVNGAVRIPYGDAGKAISATWKGVIVQGWGPGCGCDPGEDGTVFLPFINGSYFFADKAASADGSKTISVKRGGSATVE